MPQSRNFAIRYVPFYLLRRFFDINRYFNTVAAEVLVKISEHRQLITEGLQVLAARHRFFTLSNLADSRHFFRMGNDIAKEQAVQSAVIKRSIVLAGHRTSVSIEDEFWFALKEIANRKATTLSALVAQIDSKRTHNNLSSAVRQYVLAHYRERTAWPVPTAVSATIQAPMFARPSPDPYIGLAIASGNGHDSER